MSPMPGDICRVVVTFAVEGFHRWPAATGARAYLSAKHRHLFRVRVELGVYGGDREVECHDLRDFCVSHFPGGDRGSLSCEHMAELLAHEITLRYGKRRVVVEVMEDGEVGAVYEISR